MPDHLLNESDRGIVRLTLNRPEKRNALSFELLQEPGRRDRVHRGRSRRRGCVVLGSHGPVFCSGHDLSEMVGRTEDEYRELFALCSRVMLGLRRLPQPVIARVQGFATAAGCQLVAACDLAVAAEEATFATPGVKIGLFCTTPMVPLVRAIPSQGGHGDAPDRRADLGPARPGAGTGQSRGRPGRARFHRPVARRDDRRHEPAGRSARASGRSTRSKGSTSPRLTTAPCRS